MDARQLVMGKLSHHAVQFIKDSTSAVMRIPLDDVFGAGLLCSEALNNGNKIIAVGNGGSMCDAMHFCSELMGKYKNPRTPLPAICPSDPAYLSCVSNDFGYEEVFARYVRGVGRTGDVLLALSTSMKSVNVLNAMYVAHEKGMECIAITGDHDLTEESMGAPAYLVKMPSKETAIIQQCTIVVLHMLCDIIENNEI